MRIQNKIALILSVILIMMTGVSCNDHPSIYHEKEFKIENFEGVRLGGAFKVKIRQAKEFSVTAKGKKEDLKKLQIEVVNGILIASCRQGSINSQTTILEIAMPVLRSAKFHGTTSSVITGFNVRRENIKLVLSDSSRVLTDVDCNSLDLKIEGDSVLVFKNQITQSQNSLRSSSRLLGRGGICEYSYHRVGWI